MIASSDHRPHPTRAVAAVPAPWLVAGMAFCFYLPGAARFPLPGDSSLYVTRSCHLWLNSYAQTHPLYLVAGHVAVNLLAWLRPPLALALMSAAFAAVALGLVYATIRRVTGGSAGAVVGTAALAVSHTFWFHAEFAEVYSLNALFMAAMIYCAVRWWEAGCRGRGAGGPRPRATTYDLPAETAGSRGHDPRPTTHDPRPTGGPGEWLPLCLLAFLGGLGCANHLLAGVTLAVCGVWAAVLTVRHRRPSVHLLAAGASGLAGLSFLLALLVRDAQILGWGRAIRMALFGGAGIRGHHLALYSGDMGRLFSAAGVKQVLLSTGALVYNFAGVLAWAAAVWLLYRWKKRVALPCADGQGADDVPPPVHAPRPATCDERAGRVPPATPRKAVIALLFSLFAVHFAFGATYTIHEGWAFLLPAWVALACLAGVAMDAWLGRGEAAPRLTPPLQQAARRLESVPPSQLEPAVSAGILLRPDSDQTVTTCDLPRAPARLSRLWWAALGFIVLVPVVLYAVAPWAVSRIARKATAAKAAPHYMLTPRQYLAYYLWPPKSGAGARAQWLEAALDSLPEGATVLLSPAHHAMALYYREVEGRRPDLTVRGVSRSVLAEALAGGRIVFVDRLTEVETLRREGRVLDTRGCCGMWAVEDTERP